jgi:hypothetical protein
LDGVKYAQANHLELAASLWVVHKVCVLHHVQAVGLNLTLLVQVLLGDVTKHTFLYPFMRILVCNKLLLRLIIVIHDSLDLEEFLGRQLDLDDNSFNFYILDLINISFFGEPFGPLFEDSLNDPVHHVRGVRWLKLLVVVDTHLFAARLYDEENHGEEVYEVYHHLDVGNGQGSAGPLAFLEETLSEKCHVLGVLLAQKGPVLKVGDIL